MPICPWTVTNRVEEFDMLCPYSGGHPCSLPLGASKNVLITIVNTHLPMARYK
jgi:hypothetical protein